MDKVKKVKENSNGSFIQDDMHKDKVENVKGSCEEGNEYATTTTRDLGTIKPELVRSKKTQNQLIPGIPDDITLDIITLMLSPINLRLLFSASREWQEVIKSRRVYDTRLRTLSTESFVLFMQSHPFPPSLQANQAQKMYAKTISMYSPSNKSSFKLPRIPRFLEGMPLDCRTVALDGKLYVLGGAMIHDSGCIMKSELREVYVLDLAAGQMQWKQCASMLDERRDFSSAVKDGKIYVFGGTDYKRTQGAPSNRCEVYDPNVDAWTSIKPMPTFRNNHEVAIVGEEIFLHSAKGKNASMMGLAQFISYMWSKKFAEVYHTVHDKWRVIVDYNGPELDALSVSGEFQMTATGVYGRDTDGGLWKLLKLFLPRGTEEQVTHYRVNLEEAKILAVGDKLITFSWNAGHRYLTEGIRCAEEFVDIEWSRAMQVEEDSSLLCTIEL